MEIKLNYSVTGVGKRLRFHHVSPCILGMYTCMWNLFKRNKTFILYA